MKYNKSQIIQMAKEQKVTFVRLQFSDLLGTLKGVEIPVELLESALNNEIMFDGSSVEGFVRLNEADMYLYPDLNTWLVLEWEHPPYGKVARLICDVYTVDGKPFEGDPRFVLKNSLKKMESHGFGSFNVGFEPEFFLFKLDENGEPTLKFTDYGSYFDMAPIDGAKDCRRDIMLELSRLGFQMQTAHHEVANSQHEINFKFANALEACDNVQTFKIVVKNIAKKHGMHATFMPKPIANINGSGMHTNCSLTDKEGNNAFYDEKTNGLSDVCRKWISGILNHANEFTLVTNPTVNSYKRLVVGYEAPTYVCWSDANRSTMIRIPAARGKATRTEVRSVDTSANPYLACAAILECGLDGILNCIDVIEPTKVNVFALDSKQRKEANIKCLPQDLYSAIKEFENSEFIQKALGKHISDKLITAKKLEWNEYRTTVHEWEIKKYLHLI